MPQLFAWPRTANDNPFVESMFGSIKRAPQYSGRFLDHIEAIKSFDECFPWYNKQHLHSGIDLVTPDQCHKGLRQGIITHRKKT